VKRLTVAAAIFVVYTLSPLAASGPLAFYGIIEKVVFEPNEKEAERIQVWGAFAYVDGRSVDGHARTSPASRGYLYFKLRSSIPGFTTDAQVELIKKEWADLKSVAGTGQAVGFGRYGYIGSFSTLPWDDRTVAPRVLLEDKPQGGAWADLRVRPASEAPANPATYQTDVGIVKLSEQGSLAAIVKQLKEALKK
jgi:hypothetical protein